METAKKYLMPILTVVIGVAIYDMAIKPMINKPSMPATA